MLEIIHELTESTLRKIVKVIDDGGVVAFPTETVYALAADVSNYKAVEKIYQLKRRFSEKPLPILIGDINQAKRIAEFDERATKLALRFFPGSITLVLKANIRHNLASNVNPQGGTIGLRMPNNIAALKILKAVGRPLIGTSANISNQKSATCAAEIVNAFNDQINMIVDLGATESDIASTIIDLTEPQSKILREGVVSKKKIEDILGEIII